jgi:RimJ/RimL family protein N-acetyltransferase
MARDLRTINLVSPRLALHSFSAADAPDSFAAATPKIARFMGWDPASSLEAFAEIWRAWLPHMEAGTDLPLVVRLRETGEFLGAGGLHNLASAEPEVGIWIKEQAHGCGYGREAVATAIAWASRELSATGFIYPVVVENRASRHLAERLGGRLVGTRTLRKPSGAVFDQVVYRIPPAA